jgi:hypothetical protein
LSIWCGGGLGYGIREGKIQIRDVKKKSGSGIEHLGSNFRIREGKIHIRDKHTGSATLLYRINNVTGTD